MVGEKLKFKRCH